GPAASAGAAVGRFARRPASGRPDWTPQPLYGFDVRHRPARPLRHGGHHGADVLRRGAAAAADDAGAGVARQYRVIGHDLRRAVVDDGAFAILRDPAIPLGDQDLAGPRRPRQPQHAVEELRRPGAAIRAEGGEPTAAV